MRWFIFISLFPLFLAAGCSGGRYADIRGGPGRATGDFLFSTDVALFQTTRDSINVVIYLQFPNSALTFEKDEDGFGAAYGGTIAVNTLSGRPVVTNEFEGRIDALSYEVAHSLRDFEYREVVIRLVPETYSVTVTLQDRNSLRKGVMQRILEVAPFPQDMISVSSIVFAEAIERDSAGGYVIIPNTERIYGERLPTLSFYCEMYVPEGYRRKGMLSVQYEIVSQRTGNSLFLGDVNPAEPGQGKAALSGSLPLRGIDEEDVVVVIRVLGNQGKRLAERRGNFHIHWSLINWGDDFELSLAQLELVASGEVISEYKKIEPEQRETFLKKYWKKRDPIPRTEQNELLIEFEKRLRLAQRELGGIRTDKAEVYIQNGPPQDVKKKVIRDTFGYSRYAEIWVYFEPYREYVFVEGRLIQR